MLTLPSVCGPELKQSSVFLFSIKSDALLFPSSAGYVILEDNSPLSKALEEKKLPETLFRTVQADNHGTTDQHEAASFFEIISSVFSQQLDFISSKNVRLEKQGSQPEMFLSPDLHLKLSLPQGYEANLLPLLVMV